jgi:diguanylate cyclase (GGDEF)-like protein
MIGRLSNPAVHPRPATPRAGRPAKVASPRLRRLGCSILATCIAGLHSVPLAAAPAVPADRDLAGRVTALARDHGHPPSEILGQLRALAPALDRAPLELRDTARLLEIETLLDLAQTGPAETLALALQADPQRAGDARALSRSDLGLLRVRLRQSRIPEAAALARQILGRRDALRGDALEIDWLQASADAMSRSGEKAAALALLVEALAVADRTQRHDREPRLVGALCNVNMGLRDFDKALAYCNRARSLAERENDQQTLAGSSINLAVILSEKGDFRGQRRELERALAIAQAMKIKRAEAMVRVNLADLAMAQKDWKSAALHARAGLQLAESLADRTMIAVARTNLGQSLAELGDLADGIRTYEQGVEDAEVADELEYVVDFLPGLADLYARAGRMPDALDAMRRRVREGEKLYQRAQARANAEMQGRFDARQREQEIALLKRDNELQAATLETRRLQQRSVFMLAAILVLVALVLLQAYWRVRRANRTLAQTNTALAFESNHDPLTGSLNRRSLQLLLERSTGDPPSLADSPPMGFVLADIDHFKRVNDTWGHSAGDAVLVEFARRLIALTRDGDRLFRWGGEEFLLLLPQWSARGTSQLCRRILEAVGGRPFEVEGQPLALTVSLGACPFPLLRDEPLARDWKRHLHLADLALYQSKSSGRNRACSIVSLADGSQVTLDAIEAGLEAAADAGLVTLASIEPHRDARE